jgi:tRNA(adenine34) deaminase
VIDIVRHSAFNHQVEVTSGVLETECAEQLSAFFRRRRKEKKTAKALAKLDALQAIPAKLNK